MESAEYMLTVRALGHHLERGETAQEWAERLDEYRFTKVAVAAAEEASAASAETAAALAAEVATQAAAAEQRRRVWDARALALPSHEGLATTIRLNLPLMPHLAFRDCAALWGVCWALHGLVKGRLREYAEALISRLPLERATLGDATARRLWSEGGPVAAVGRMLAASPFQLHQHRVLVTQHGGQGRGYAVPYTNTMFGGEEALLVACFSLGGGATCDKLPRIVRVFEDWSDDKSAGGESEKLTAVASAVGGGGGEETLAACTFTLAHDERHDETNVESSRLLRTALGLPTRVLVDRLVDSAAPADSSRTHSGGVLLAPLLLPTGETSTTSTTSTTASATTTSTVASRAVPEWVADECFWPVFTTCWSGLRRTQRTATRGIAFGAYREPEWPPPEPSRHGRGGVGRRGILGEPVPQLAMPPPLPQDVTAEAWAAASLGQKLGWRAMYMGADRTTTIPAVQPAGPAPTTAAADDEYRPRPVPSLSCCSLAVGATK